MARPQKYDDTMIDAFIEMAQDIGISRSQRELGYPASWATADKWIKARGIEITVDSLKTRSSEFNQWYETEEVLLVAQAGMDRIHEMLLEDTLDADAAKKLMEAFQKVSNTWMLLKGKATGISETRTIGETDLAIAAILAEEETRNNMIEKDIKEKS